MISWEESQTLERWTESCLKVCFQNNTTIPLIEQVTLTLTDHLMSTHGLLRGSCCSIFSVLCSVWLIVVCLFIRNHRLWKGGLNHAWRCVLSKLCSIEGYYAHQESGKSHVFTIQAKCHIGQLTCLILYDTCSRRLMVLKVITVNVFININLMVIIGFAPCALNCISRILLYI
jgi:hypothetical protein